VSSAATNGDAGTSHLTPLPDLTNNRGYLRASVIICAYSERRWEQTYTAVKSVLSQSPQPAEVLLVIDHNPELAARARSELPDITILESDGTPGLSDARNTGLRAATQPIASFLDDDAEARPGWLASLMEPYRSADVVATGGTVHPCWPGSEPRWLPPEFYWVIGCSYRGLPLSVSPVRNPIGANMSLRTPLALRVGGFDSAVGRVGARPVGCEETELAIRLTAAKPSSAVLYVPSAIVDHHIQQERLNIRYFLRRCWHEGISKANVVQLAGALAGLESERRYVAVVIPMALLQNLRRGLAGDMGALMRLTAVLAGLISVASGYLVGRLRKPGGSRPQINHRLPDHTEERTSNADQPRKATASMLSPARILDIEISGAVPIVDAPAHPDGGRYRIALVLVRLHGCPLGTVQFNLASGPVSAGQVADRIWGTLRTPILAHLAEDRLPAVEMLSVSGIAHGGEPRCQHAEEGGCPFTSVVISTHERPGPLSRCIDSVLRADYPSFEVLVVDNAPRTSATWDMIAERYPRDSRVRYLLEPTPGASAGRNCGLRAAGGEVVAFLDDDVLADRFWLRNLVLGFQAAPGVACVTGLIVPAELETPAQVWVEEFGGFDKGYQRQIFDLGEFAPPDPLYPYAVGKFGSGANAAFDTTVLRSVGGFDTALGPATPARGGEDIDAFLQIILAGYRLVYEPRSLVRHHHRPDYADLRRTVQGYGVGLSAVVTKALMNPATRADILKRVPRGVVYLLNPSSSKNAKKTSTFPRELTMVELGGVLMGPWYYLHSRRWARAVARADRASQTVDR
jgi:O-antigen biosynthesis protein